MKARLLLCLSLVTNVALVALAAWLWQRPSSGGARMPAGGGTPSSDVGSAPTASVPLPGAEASAPRLAPETLAAVVRAGVSQEALVNALLEEFNRRWDAKFTELQRRYAPRSAPRAEVLRLQRAREAAEAKEIIAVVGEAAYLEWDRARAVSFVNPTRMPLNAEESEALYRIQKELEHQQEEIEAAREDGVADQADAQALHAQAQDEYEEKLQKLLGKERLAEMRGEAEVSDVEQVYRAYAALEPTEEQARAIAALDRTLETSRKELAASVAADPQSRTALLQGLAEMDQAKEESFRKILGPEVYEQRKREGSESYQTLRRYAEAWGLSGADVNAVYSRLDTLRAEMARERLAADLQDSVGMKVDWSAASDRLTELMRQAEGDLQQMLGPVRAERLKRNGLLSAP